MTFRYLRLDEAALAAAKLQRVAPGFAQSPRSNPVCVAFVMPCGLADLKLQNELEATLGLEAFCTEVRALVARHGGYECQEDMGCFMLAFPASTAVLHFADELPAAVAGTPLQARFGAFTDTATSLEPHTSTGRLDIFGPFVNRAARLAKAARPGQCLVRTANQQKSRGEEKRRREEEKERREKRRREEERREGAVEK